MNFKKLGVLIIGIATLVATGCSNTTTNTNKDSASTPAVTQEEKVLRIGINGEEGVLWKSMKERLKAEGIRLEVISFSDYIIPNTALVDGEIDANAFQTEVFFENFLKESGADLTNVGYTILAPMAIYPGKVKQLSDLPDGAKIAIPNDLSNGGRALILLQAAGLIQLNPDKGILPTVKDITENPKNIQIVELAPAMIPTSMDEFEVACINNGVAKNAGLSIKTDAIFVESTESDYIKSYYNIIAVQTKDIEKPEIKKLVEIYQSEENKKAIDEEYKGNAIPAF